ncbi:MAG TPA: hypothetical protein VL633_08205 [Bacteroidota bacterium]|nr:hypothetical protein [Bacteroidota bacterium]
MNKKWLVYWLVMLVLFLMTSEIGASLFGTTNFIGLLDVVMILFALIAIIAGVVITLIRKQSKFLPYSLVNILLTGLFLVVAYWFPSRAVINLIRGKPKIVAFYEGTQNDAVLKLRERKNFDIWWTGWFGGNTYFKGTYDQAGDSLRFYFDGTPPRNFNGLGEFVRLKDSSLCVRFFNTDHDTNRRDGVFYVSKKLSGG